MDNGIVKAHHPEGHRRHAVRLVYHGVAVAARPRSEYWEQVPCQARLHPVNDH
jgi:hypothetical protein